jgi:citronellyl-CoA synthetase
MSREGVTKGREFVKFRHILPGLILLFLRFPSLCRFAKSMFLLARGKGNRSLGAHIENNARKHPDKTALLCGDLVLTHREFNEAVNRYANFFLARGMEKGDVAVVMLENRPELMMIMAAMAKTGGIASLINTNLRGDSLAHCINLTSRKLFIVGEELIEAFEDVKPMIHLTDDEPLYYVRDEGRNPAQAGYIDLSEEARDTPIDNPPTTAERKMLDTFAFMFTSGTTGLPKAAYQMNMKWVLCANFLGSLGLSMNSADVMYISVPLTHNVGVLLGWSVSAINGSAIALRRKFSITHFWDDIRKYNATCFPYIGEICRYLMNRPEDVEDRNNPVKKVVGVGLRPEIYKAFKKRFGIPRVVEFYGSSEGTVIYINLYNVDCTMGTCMMPHAVVAYDVERDEPIRDENGFMTRVEKGEPGLLLGKLKDADGYPGYTDRKATSQKILRHVFKKDDAWFNTGDLVRNIGCGHAEFVDRVGDTFRWKGENVSTAEVEKVIHSTGFVRGAAVYGVRIPLTDGRIGMAAVIPGTGVESFDFRKFTGSLQEALPPYAIPRFIRFKAEFETTSTHKIMKSRIREEGFDLDAIEDPLFVLLRGAEEYQPLSRELFDEIMSGAMQL